MIFKQIKTLKILYSFFEILFTSIIFIKYNIVKITPLRMEYIRELSVKISEYSFHMNRVPKPLNKKINNKY